MSNQYTYTTPFTEKELHRDYFLLKMSQCEIAKKYNTTQKVVWKAMKRLGFQPRKAAKRNQSGNNNSTWKGGRTLQAKKAKQRDERSSFGNGYFYLRFPEHPNANKSGYVAEHIVVATQERGRPLNSGEIVHHIDLNKHNNSPSNLAITDKTTHANWHNQLEEIAISFMLEGLVKFDPQIGYYRDAGEQAAKGQGHSSPSGR